MRSADTSQDQDAFGWTDEGRTSEACRRASARAVQRCWPYIALVLVAIGALAAVAAIAR